MGVLEWKLGFGKSILCAGLVFGSAYVGDVLNVASVRDRWEQRDASWSGSYDRAKIGLSAQEEYVNGASLWQSYYTKDGVQYRIGASGFPDVPPHILMEREDIQIGLSKAAEKRADERLEELIPLVEARLQKELLARGCQDVQENEEKKEWWENL